MMAGWVVLEVLMPRKSTQVWCVREQMVGLFSVEPVDLLRRRAREQLNLLGYH